MATLKDIAKEAGVSIMTVSNVVNGNHNKVSNKTIELVTEIARKYNYIPNVSARSLVGKSNNMLSLIIPAFHSGNFFLNPYNGIMIGEIERAVNLMGYYVMIHSVEQYIEMVNVTRRWSVDGAIVHGVFEEELRGISASADRGNALPTVVLDSYIDSSGVLSVGIDDFKGGYLAARYLLSRGHSEIGFVSFDFDESVAGVLSNRYRGFCSALREAGIEPRPDYRIDLMDTNYQAGIMAGQAVGAMRSRPSAVFVPSDIAAIGVMEGARLSGLSVPEELSVVGFDDLECCQYCSPKLTTIHQDIKEKAFQAVEALVNQLEKGQGTGLQSTLDVFLVERQSVITRK